MQQFRTYVLLIITIGLLLPLGLRAQEQLPSNQVIDNLIIKYQDTEGVNCINLSKGEGLGIVKLAMRKYMSAKLLRNITQIAIIEYSAASSDLVNDVQNDLNAHFAQMQLLMEESTEDGQQKRCFINCSDSTSDISDVFLTIEGNEYRCCVYLHGTISREYIKSATN